MHERESKGMQRKERKGKEWKGRKGMQKNAIEWNGMEWNGMEWNGMEWNAYGSSGGMASLPSAPGPAQAADPQPTPEEWVEDAFRRVQVSTLCSVWVRPKCAPAEESTHSPLQGPLGPPLGPRRDPEGTLKDPKGPLKDP